MLLSGLRLVAGRKDCPMRTSKGGGGETSLFVTPGGLPPCVLTVRLAAWNQRFHI